jgi:hypothetical protein
MSRALPENLHVQLVPIDHESLYSVVLYAYERVSRGADRGFLHRAALGLDYRADPDEVNRLRGLQRRLREVGGADAAALEADIEGEVAREYARERTAQHLATLPIGEVKDLAVRWCSVGKRGPALRISPELIGLLAELFPGDRAVDGFPAWLEGTDEPLDRLGGRVFPVDGSGQVLVYREPPSVLDVYKRLSFLTRDALDDAISAVVGAGEEAEEAATWLEADFEALTLRYEIAAAGRYGLHYRYR